jgi:myo-inositol-1(or 4)-monophosphatase
VTAVSSPAPLPPPPSEDTSLDGALAVLSEGLDDVAGWLLASSGDLEVTEKADGTPVTSADTTVDDRLRARLADAFPAHGILSEERGTLAPTTAWTWVIDPVDGTSNYTNRLPYWCISVALLFEGRPVLGVVDAPVLGRRYVAVKGRGGTMTSRTTSLDGRDQQPISRPLRVRPPVAWRDPVNGHVPVMLTTGTARRARGAGLALNPRVMGSTALDMALVAEGVAAASIAMVPKVWDIAAGALLVEEAGGVVVTVDADPLLPLVGGVEQEGRAAITATGPDEAYVQELVAALLGASPR